MSSSFFRDTGPAFPQLEPAVVEAFKDEAAASAVASETSRVASDASAIASATSAANAAASVQAAAGTATPLVDGAAAVGTGTKWAHEDHVHPTDTSRAPLASPALTGTPTAPTPTVGDNSTKIATTAFVLANGGVPATATPLVDGTAAVGASNKYAREDHVHPTDASRAPVASPSFTGSITQTSVSASAVAVGPAGATNPTLQVDSSVGSAVTGVLFQGRSATAGVYIVTLSSGANEGMVINPKGSGKLTLSNQSSLANVYVGNGAFTGDDSAVLINRAHTPASGLLNSHSTRDESVLTQNVTASGFSGYASYDSAPQITGSCTTPMNHIHSFQARPIFSSTGHVQEVAGLTAQATITSAGVIDNFYGGIVSDAIKSGGGTITNQYGYYANTLSGGTNNYFLWGGNNPSVFQGVVRIGRSSNISVETLLVEYNGSTQFGVLTSDTYASAATLPANSFYRAGSLVGSITTTLTGTQYTSASDETLKDFIGPYSPEEAIRIIRADPVREFTWKSDGSYEVGWGAQTSYAVSHDLAIKPHHEGQVWSIDRSRRTPYLWAAVSALLDRVDTLEARLKALEAKT